MNLFEQATRNKLRFASAKGSISTEDLWSLSIEALDFMAAELHNELQQKQITFIKSRRNKADTLTQLKFDVVKHIIEVKEDELEAKELQKATLARKQQLLELKHKKESEKLESLSLEEIDKQLEQL